MCGIVAVIHADSSSNSAAADLLDALFLLQHRGQDACGIATCAAGGLFTQCKGQGLASKVFDESEKVGKLPGYMGLGHLRYPTAGTPSAAAEAQPFYVNAPFGICFAHNGNLLNTRELKTYLDQVCFRHCNTLSDSEVLLNIFASELQETKKARINVEDCVTSLERTYARCRGSWACTAMIAGFGLIGFRDPYGIRPLCLGARTHNGETDYMLASESVALNFFGTSSENVVDILPGQAVIIQKGQKPVFHQIQKPFSYAPDIFEYVYFARPDSVIDGISVYASRRSMGAFLARRIEAQLSEKQLAEIDAVIPIPETSNTSARVVAQYLKKELVEGFVKNRYIFRTFIMPTQKLRRTGVRRKLNAIHGEFKDKNVLLIDDSIVRGTTSREIVLMAREAGAKKVFFASCAPPITFPHIYGIDLASSTELIAHNKSDAQIATEIGADMVIFQTLPDLEAACAALSPRKDEGTQKFEVGVFCGKYITPVEDGYLDHLEALRGATKKGKADEIAWRVKLDEQKLNGARKNMGPTGGEETNGSLSPPSSSSQTQDVSLHNFNDYA